MSALRVPVATCRLQFSRRFRFRDARGLLPYLEALGVTDLYASPFLRARRGSPHGYDVTDPARLNPELGTEAELKALASDLAVRGMGLLLDIVPNHMAASGENRWWMDVLEHGDASPFATFFDIDWRPPKKALERKVLLPILGAPYGRVLENQELSLRLERRGFFIHYGGHKLPVAPRSYPRILSHRLEAFEETYGRDHPSFRELWEVLAAFERLPEPATPDPAAAAQGDRDEKGLKRRLWRLHSGRAEVRAHIEGSLRLFNGRREEPGSFALLDRLLDEQHYWLSYWRLANEEINYRRFFAIGDLISVRVEDPAVFAPSHALVLRLAREGTVTGLRIDHVDGLYDPRAYLAELARRLAPDPPGPPAEGPPFFVVVEKILGPDEPLPADWPVCGTTGYDFLNLVNGLFVSARGARTLGEIYDRFVGGAPPCADIVYRGKKGVMESLFAGEMFTLGQHLGRLAERDRYGRDLPRKELREALIEVTACFPVYRTYIREADLAARDRLSLARALKEARRRNGDLGDAVFDFLRRVLTLEFPPFLAAEQKEEWLRFLMRWQQYTGPIMAKGFEDTALYVHNRLVSLNEVGGDPSSAGVPAPAFHRRMEAAAAQWPHALNATSTHDTKRSEDVRARIDVLSELPEEWEKHLLTWRLLNEPKRVLVKGMPVPDPNEEVLLYQTLLGVWPLDPDELPGLPERLREYMVKAAREAKIHTRWIRPDPAHENALRIFVDAILMPAEENRFLADFLPFQERIARFGALNSLGQLLLKVAAPGVPDFYQGTELWRFLLVDPDNRRPVDFALRARLLGDLVAREPLEGLLSLARDLLVNWRDGRVKLYVTWKALQFRKGRPDLFATGGYLPLQPFGAGKEHVVAFARTGRGRWALAAVPRFSTRLTLPGEFPLGPAAWGARSGLALPADAPEGWTNVFTGEALQAAGARGRRELPLHDLFRAFPVALLEGTL